MPTKTKTENVKLEPAKLRHKMSVDVDAGEFVFDWDFEQETSDGDKNDEG